MLKLYIHRVIKVAELGKNNLASNNIQSLPSLLMLIKARCLSFHQSLVIDGNNEETAVLSRGALAIHEICRALH